MVRARRLGDGRQVLMSMVQALSNPATLRRLMREVAKLKNAPPEGIRVSTDGESVTSLVGIVAGPGVPRPRLRRNHR